jgi:hypothetical protein
MDNNLFIRFPSDGLIKTADKPAAAVAADQKARLNRKGNEIFNRGDIETARRIFQTTGYSDGLIRVGERYMADNHPVDALKMYWLAHDERRIEELVGKMALVIQNLLREAEEEK